MVEWSPRYLVGLDNEVLAGQLEDALELLSRSVESVYSRTCSREANPYSFKHASILAILLSYPSNCTIALPPPIYCADQYIPPHRQIDRMYRDSFHMLL